MFCIIFGRRDYRFYDNLSRLIEADYNNGANVYNYGYDVAGNMVNNNGTVRTFNDANQLADTGFVYDANGNLVNDGVNSYVWDRANRLLSHDGLDYAYDGAGNRISQDNGTDVTKYLLDVQPQLAKVLSQTVGSDTDYFVHGIRGIHAQKVDSKWEYLAQDGLMSIRSIVDVNANVTNSISYTPYGVPDTSVNGFAFTGEMRDTNGLQYHRARYYDASLGIWTAEDFLETPNRYTYVSGNSVNRVDRNGLQEVNELDLDGNDVVPPLIRGASTYTSGSNALNPNPVPPSNVPSSVRVPNNIIQFPSASPNVNVVPSNPVQTSPSQMTTPLNGNFSLPSFGMGSTPLTGQQFGLGFAQPNFGGIAIPQWLINSQQAVGQFGAFCGTVFNELGNFFNGLSAPDNRTSGNQSTDQDDGSDSCNSSSFTLWWNSMPPAPIGGNANFDRYESRVARGAGTLGTSRRIPTGFIKSDGVGENIDADGASAHNCRIIEAKHASNLLVPAWRDDGFKPILDKADYEILRYARIVISPITPAKGLEIRTNSPVSQMYFQTRLPQFGLIVGVNGFVNLVP